MAIRTLTSTAMASRWPQSNSPAWQAAATSRGADLVARWGGDEFLVIGIGPEPNALDYADRITANMDLSELESAWHGRTSVGTAVGAHSELSSVISAADAAMYSSRLSGNNRLLADQ